jgi:hypothetical protein
MASAKSAELASALLSGYRLIGDCRELYLEWHEDEPSRNVMKLRQPIAR